MCVHIIFFFICASCYKNLKSKIFYGKREARLGRNSRLVNSSQHAVIFLPPLPSPYSFLTIFIFFFQLNFFLIELCLIFFFFQISIIRFGVYLIVQFLFGFMCVIFGFFNRFDIWVKIFSFKSVFLVFQALPYFFFIPLYILKSSAEHQDPHARTNTKFLSQNFYSN